MLLHSHQNDTMYPLSAPSLAHSNAFRPQFLNLERFEPSEIDPWYFCHIPPPSCTVPFRLIVHNFWKKTRPRWLINFLLI
jgi:hypothetical protein